jgi:hypothetical protein
MAFGVIEESVAESVVDQNSQERLRIIKGEE